MYASTKAFVTAAGTCFALLATALFIAAIFLFLQQGLDAAWRPFAGANITVLIVASFDQLWWEAELENLRRQGLVDFT